MVFVVLFDVVFVVEFLVVFVVLFDVVFVVEFLVVFEMKALQLVVMPVKLEFVNPDGEDPLKFLNTVPKLEFKILIPEN